MRSWTDCFFSFTYFSKEKSKKCEHNIENWNSFGLEFYRPSIKSTKLMIKAIKTIIIRHSGWCAL